jgi:cytochrome c peroxidase
MKKYTILLLIFLPAIFLCSMNRDNGSEKYFNFYSSRVNDFDETEQSLITYIKNAPVLSPDKINAIKEQLWKARLKMKGLDFWLRYLEPTVYKKINGPLPVEWETEVFEKFEKPYKRNGAWAYIGRTIH